MTGRRAERPNRYGAFLLYVDDWLSSTPIELMTAAEERGYLRLLMHAWKSPDCGLPNDDKTLAQLSKLGGAWRGKSGDVLRARFLERDGRLFNERLLRERQHQQEVRHSRSEASRKANAARWDASRNPSRNTDGSVSDPIPNPSPRSTDHDNDSLATPVQPGRISPRITPEDISTVKRAIAEYMQAEPDESIVIETIEAGGGASVDDICGHLKALWLKGCKPGKAKGPRGFGWFVAVTRQHFSDQRAMEDARLNPNAVTRWSEKQADTSELDAGMDAF